MTRQAIQEKIETLEVMDELTSESNLTESDVQEIVDNDVQEIVDNIHVRGRKRVDEESA